MMIGRALRGPLRVLPDLLPGLVMLAACNADVNPDGGVVFETSAGGATAQPTGFTGPDETSTTIATDDDDNSDTDETSGTPSVVCPETHACVPEPPTDWHGPVTKAESLVASAVQPDCPADYPEIDVEAFSGVVAPAPACRCSCGEASGAACAPALTLRHHGTGGCTNINPTTMTVTTGTCFPLSTPFAAGSSWVAEPLPTQGGSCEASSEVAIDEPQFERRVVACGGAEALAGCAAGNACLPKTPESFGAAMCIWRDGQHSCPSTFPRPQRFFRSIEDQRTCLPCECGPAQGLCESAAVILHGVNTCTAMAGGLSANGDCQTSFGTATHAIVSPGSPTSFCSPSQGTPIGDAVGSDGVTICCQNS